MSKDEKQANEFWERVVQKSEEVSKRPSWKRDGILEEYYCSSYTIVTKVEVTIDEK